ncbi:MAG: FecR domain-containing protein [Candidatus Omnitrophica bacterium]|nr:FecR domain-containing protein [Candidatus Omnitrophota bacterium]MCM8789120.1 FecR domain-containing protein [Candidatus Omnitrophota bacterium]
MKKGFSLIEILIISFIVVSLGAMVFGIVFRSKALSKSMVCLNNLRQISIAIEAYQADWRSSPNQLYALFPNYIKDKYSFRCPEDRLIASADLPQINSYGNFYINRSFNEEDPQKLYLYCPRHFNGTKAVGAFLSYSANVMQTNKVTRNGINIMPGEVYAGGIFNFADGTVVTADPNLKVGLCGSFIAPDDKHYSVIFVPEDSSGSLTVDHQGDSRFEVIAPALIAGVSGTRFTVSNTYDSSKNQATTTVSVEQGKVICEDRTDGTKIAVKQSENLSATIECQRPELPNDNKTKSIPRKPLKKIKVWKF